MNTLSRRTVLRGAGGVAVGLPFLEAMFPRRARAAVLPRRLLIWFTGNGTIPGRWGASGSQTSFTLAPILAPLQDYKSDIVVVGGLTLQGSGGDGHTDGMGGNLTGMPLKPGGIGSFGTGTSIDQYLAQKVKAANPAMLGSIETSVGPRGGSTWGRLSYLNSVPVPSESSPAKVFDRLFSGFTPGGAATDATQAAQLAALRDQRRSLLDRVTADYATLSRRLGGADRQRLESHLAAIRELELTVTAVAATTSAGAACKPAMPPTGTDYPTLGNAMVDLIVMAFVCDRVRVASIMWEGAADARTMPWIGETAQHHAACHNGQNDQVEKILVWFTQQFAALIGKMKSIKEGTGTLLDSSLVFATSEQADGHSHSWKNMPYVLAGSAGGAIRTGRYMSYPGQPHPNLLVSILNAFDQPLTTFGNPPWCTGPLPGLVG
jgi:hypothetical protein